MPHLQLGVCSPLSTKPLTVYMAGGKKHLRMVSFEPQVGHAAAHQSCFTSFLKHATPPPSVYSKQSTPTQSLHANSPLLIPRTVAKNRYVPGRHPFSLLRDLSETINFPSHTFTPTKARMSCILKHFIAHPLSENSGRTVMPAFDSSQSLANLLQPDCRMTPLKLLWSHSSHWPTFSPHSPFRSATPDNWSSLKPLLIGLRGLP